MRKLKRPPFMKAQTLIPALCPSFQCPTYITRQSERAVLGVTLALHESLLKISIDYRAQAGLYSTYGSPVPVELQEPICLKNYLSSPAVNSTNDLDLHTRTTHFRPLGVY